MPIAMSLHARSLQRLLAAPACCSYTRCYAFMDPAVWLHQAATAAAAAQQPISNFVLRSSSGQDKSGMHDLAALSISDASEISR